MEQEINYCMIPRIDTDKDIAKLRYAMLVTSKRIALIKIGQDHSGYGLAAGGIGGFLMGKLLEDPNTDLRNMDIDMDALLAESKENKVYPLDRIVEIRLKKDLMGKYRIIIFALNKKNKKKQILNGFLEVERKDYAHLIDKGLDISEARKYNAWQCQELLRKYLGHKLTQLFYFGR